MTQIDPAELSALLDGELPQARAAELRAAITANPALRAEFEALADDDANWRRAAASAQFAPAIDLTRARLALDSTAILSGILAVLLVVRGLSKLPDAMAWGLAAQAVTLCAVLAWAIHLVLAADTTATAPATKP